MRVVKFRGKRIVNGDWIYGDLFREIALTPTSRKRKSEFSGFWAIQTETPDGIKSYSVDPETVGQFTGEKDINGVDIYEGDIVDCDLAVLTPFNDPDEMQHIRCKVVWERFEFRFAEEKYKYLSQWNGDLDNFKVIGNIHDNPELMEAAAQ